MITQNYSRFFVEMANGSVGYHYYYYYYRWPHYNLGNFNQSHSIVQFVLNIGI